MATINYENKEAISVNPTIPNKNKVVDSDMNLIKQVGNQILTTMGVYTDDWDEEGTYLIDDIVIYDNRIFKNLTGTNTTTPPTEDTTNWLEVSIRDISGGAEIPIQNTAPANPREDDLWIDTSEPEEMQEAIVNEYSESTTNTYSCDYVNDTIDGIIESGGNTNGYYTKYADGTLICRYYVGPLTINSNSGATQAVLFPLSFVDTNWQCMIQLTNGQNYWSWIATAVKSKTASGFTLDIWNNSEGQCPGQYFDYIAIGRWK